MAQVMGDLDEVRMRSLFGLLRSSASLQVVDIPAALGAVQIDATMPETIRGCIRLARDAPLHQLRTLSRLMLRVRSRGFR
jgi:hypothetical protein